MFNNDQERRNFTERVLESTRPVMRRWLGTTTRGYDGADEIATAIARGIEEAAKKTPDGLDLTLYYNVRYGKPGADPESEFIKSSGTDLDALTQSAADHGYTEMLDVRIQYRSTEMFFDAAELAS